VDRVVDALPAEEREQTKGFLSQSLIGVVTQVLVKTPDLRGRRAVCEIMTMNKAIGKLIMTDQTHMIASQLQTGKDAGMQLMDMALLQAVIAREVDPEDAFVYALDKRPFTRYVPDGTAILKADVTQGA
jgi:twitching motility protein PilT